MKRHLDLHGIFKHWKLTIIILLAVTLALRVAAMIWMTLVPEEAYYWMYSQHPGRCYFDHPPMIAWLIDLLRFTTSLQIFLTGPECTDSPSFVQAIRSYQAR
ncbi:MAG: hypothetical protein L0Y39_13290 [Methylococcaceae bacterium]|nr:hypothetical protein [Methylococcaceae bacterium]